MPPGTMLLTDRTTKKIVLHPTPTADSQDPLNWSVARKSINFALVLFYVLMTFVLLDIFGIAYNAYVEEWGMTFDEYNSITAASYAGLAVGCVLFIPLVYKYGRRPVYLTSIAVQLATAIWAARVNGVAEWYPLNVIQGLGGAISETIVQITIADLFFVHQYATMNGLFLLSQSMGAFLGPVAAGYVTVSQGWRWQWWWCTIFLGLSLVLAAFFLNETAYVPILEGRSEGLEVQYTHAGDEREGPFKDIPKLTETKSPVDNRVNAKSSWVKSLRLYTHTPDQVGHHIWQPFVLLVRIPAATYAALTYGILLANFAAIASVSAGWLFYPPYNFDSAGVGLFNIAPFIGALLSTVTVGPMSDWLIVRLATKNKGIYEAEMRLWPAIPSAFLACGGMLMFGVGIAQEQPWIILAVGSAIFGYGFIGCGDIALSYLTDSYQTLVGDAVVGVIFVRNVISVIILFSLTPWINAIGLQDMFISFTFITLFFLVGFPVLLLTYGKRFRYASIPLFEEYSAQQHRSRG
ncbi:MFS general substrate transporter [Thozetella sp. PMI_491]|nr:MFS general substrate transporter [Thozetella sp. PMI_491]